MWRRYYERWSAMTVENIGMIELVPEFSAVCTPGHRLDKWAYSPWLETRLHELLQEQSVDTLVVSGGETDVCFLSTVPGAVDRGCRVAIVTDALCSSSDQTHDALLTVYENRYSQEVEAVTSDLRDCK